MHLNEIARKDKNKWVSKSIKTSLRKANFHNGFSFFFLVKKWQSTKRYTNLKTKKRKEKHARQN